jgi:hypothetical protein
MVDSIPVSTLEKLPAGRFVRLDHNVPDVDNRTMIVWQFWDKDWRDLRTAYFDLETGIYRGEACFKSATG